MLTGPATVIIILAILAIIVLKIVIAHFDEGEW